MGGGKRSKAKQQPRKGKGKRVSGNPAKAAAQRKAPAAGGNPFGSPAEEVDYEKAAAALDLPKDFSKYLK